MRQADDFAVLIAFALAFWCYAVHAGPAEEQREENLRRMARIQNATALAAPKAPSAAYAMQIALAVRKSIHLDTEIKGNPEAVVRIETASDGRILNHNLVQSSGVVEWDTSVLQAIVRTERLPLEPNEALPKVIVFHFRPNE
ncbi:energy transducer TonB [Variovorax sp. J2P1-59]|uniref:energy transducer TonB n=1 Tax=Variovorax flavidus TaxID=3053501 RepID=UPI002577D74E|nr:energy transducer TonB [Variovorax sp. J2P1-59]MDM0074830.1 energy transducer TonB [Variovorax sp. J2P1-59]